MARFFDPLSCPICFAGLPAQPLRCPSCGVELTGPIVAELVTTLRRADSLVDRMRAGRTAAAVVSSPQVTVSEPLAMPRRDLPEVAAARPPAGLFAGRSVGVILLVLGALCVLAAGAVFIAVEWVSLPLVIRALIMVIITAGFGLLATLALRLGLQATAEAMAAVACGMFVLDLAAARRASLLGLADLTTASYEILAGVLLLTAALGGALFVRSRQRWLWVLDAAVALGMARAAAGVLRVPSESDGYAVATVTVTVVASLLYVEWRRLRLPVARWSALAVGGLGWLAAVELGAAGAADHAGDVGRLVAAWPALVVALVAGLWSIRLTDAVGRRVAACACLLPVLLVFEIVAWSHGWVAGSLLMLAGYVMAVLASARVPASWSPAVGGSAVVLALSAVVGLLPTLAAFATRLGLALVGDWRGPRDLPLEVWSAGAAHWLLPVTALVVLGLLPRLTIGGARLPVQPHHTAGLLAATLAVMPVLYGAGFWTSMTVLVLAAAILLGAARLWRHDSLLVLGLSLLAIMRICAYSNDLADPLAWTLISFACLVWALTERRPAISAGFFTAAGLLALASVLQWLAFSPTPVEVHGLVVVAIGSLGLVASQRLPRQAPTGQATGWQVPPRWVGEGLSVTWLVVGLAIAESSPSHRAVELTVAGVAAGITAYLSQDRHRAGWVSGVLLTVASWIRLTDYDIEAVEWYTVPAATALLVYGARRLRLGSPDGAEFSGSAESRERAESAETAESSMRCLGPGLVLGLTPSLLLALDEPVSWRGLGVGLAAVVLVALGVRLRLAAPFVLGVVATGLLALRNIWPAAAFIPRWTLLFLTGAVLLWAGMTWESRANDVRTAGRYVRGLR